MFAFWHGFLLAFGLILPLGVQNVFIFNQGAVQKKFGRTLPAVLTATVCDALLILLAVAGVSVIVMTVSAIKIVLFSIGIIFMIYMGLVAWKSNDYGNGENQGEPLSMKKQILFASSVSLFNPHAILDTIGVIGASSIKYQGMDKLFFASAGIIVSLIWFASLAIAGGILKKLNPNIIPIVNKVSAIIIWGSAVYLAINFMYL